MQQKVECIDLSYFESRTVLTSKAAKYSQSSAKVHFRQDADPTKTLLWKAKYAEFLNLRLEVITLTG